jgi:hypothetical protein
MKYDKDDNEWSVNVMSKNAIMFYLKHWSGKRDLEASVIILFNLTSFSSYCWASVANAPNVLQPYRLIVLPLDFPALTTSLLLRDPSGQRWSCIYRTSYFWTFQLSPLVVFERS